MNTFGENLKQVRIALGYSQIELGELIGSTRSYISLVEKGKSKLSVESLVKLLLDKKVNLNFLLSGQGEMFINQCENTHILIKNDKPLINYKNWGKRLCKILADNQETPYNFSKRTGINEARIEKFIMDSADPTIKELNAIKTNIDVSIDELLYAETVEKESTQPDNIGLSVSEIIQLKQLLKQTKT